MVKSKKQPLYYHWQQIQQQGFSYLADKIQSKMQMFSRRIKRAIGIRLLKNPLSAFFAKKLINNQVTYYTSDLIHRYRRTLYHHQLSSYHGKVIFFFTKKTRSFYCEKIAENRLKQIEIYDLPGKHRELFRIHLDKVAKQLQQCLGG